VGFGPISAKTDGKTHNDNRNRNMIFFILIFLLNDNLDAGKPSHGLVQMMSRKRGGAFLEIPKLNVEPPSIGFIQQF
jgi:hypothetical protein